MTKTCHSRIVTLLFYRFEESYYCTCTATYLHCNLPALQLFCENNLVKILELFLSLFNRITVVEYSFGLLRRNCGSCPELTYLLNLTKLPSACLCLCWLRFHLHICNWPFQASLFLIYVFLIQLIVNKICR